jgi:hypothetical protein
MQPSQSSFVARGPDLSELYQRAEHSYYAEVSMQRLDEQINLIDQIIDFAFDTLDARHLDLRIVDLRRIPRRAA